MYQPKGAGKRRRRKRDHNEDDDFIDEVKSEKLVRRDSQRNFFPVKANADGIRVKTPSSTADFEDNVGVTVILPGGM